MQLQKIMDALEAIAPSALAESWDNVGLLAGDPSAEVTRVLLAIDYTKAVALEARARGAQLVVAYHPPIFQALKRVVAGAPVFEAIRDGIALFSPHTALDVAAGGTNDLLADLLGLVERAPLKPRPGPPGAAALGIGRVGTLAPPVARPEVLARIKAGLGVDQLLVAGPREGLVARAAVGAGACGELVQDAIAQRVDLYLTGEMRHHDALTAARAGVTVVCALHSNSERAVLACLESRLAAACPGVAFERSREDRDPFSVG